MVGGFTQDIANQRLRRPRTLWGILGGSGVLGIWVVGVKHGEQN